MTQRVAELSEGAALTYGAIAAWFMAGLAEIDWMMVMAGGVLFIRLIYDGLRLYRYIRHKDKGE